MNTKRAIRYLRISTDRQSNYSIKGQDMRTLEWCERSGVTIVDTFIDEGYSAKTFDRPDMVKLRYFIKQHHRAVDYLVVQEFDRFSRDAGEAISLIKQLQKEYKIQVVGVNEGITFDYNNPGNFFRTGLQLLLAEDDNIRRASKINAGIYTAKKRDGRYIGAAPFGYKKEGKDKTLIMVIDEDKAKIIRFVYDSYLANVPMNTISKEAKKMGLPYTGNSNITTILKRHAYTSLLEVKAYENNPSEIVEAAHEPIITRTQWLAVQSKLKGGTAKQILNDDMPLRSVLLCNCGLPVTGAASTGRHGGKFLYYKCRESKHLNVSVKKAHAQLMEILKLMSLPRYLITRIKQDVTQNFDTLRKSNLEQINDFSKRLENCETKLHSVEEKWIMNQLTFESYDRWHKELSHERIALLAQLDKLTKVEKHIWFMVQDELDRLEDVHHVYEISNTIQKQQFIRQGFDSRLAYHDGIYRTPYILPIFSHNLLIMNEKRLLIFNQQPLKTAFYKKGGAAKSIIEPLSQFLYFIKSVYAA